jgi:hypothetical protein
MEKKSIIEKIKALFNETEETPRYVEAKTVDGKILRSNDFVAENEIFEITEEGEVKIEEGEFETVDGYKITITEGKITSILEPVAENEEFEEEETEETFANLMRTDGVAIYYAGTELVVGETALFLDEAMTEPAPEGTHELEGELIATVENGVLVALDPVEELNKKEEEEKKRKEEEEMYSTILSSLETLKSELESVKNENKELKTRFEKFANEPSETPINTKVDFSTLDKKQSREEKLKFFGGRK